MRITRMNYFIALFFLLQSLVGQASQTPIEHWFRIDNNQQVELSVDLFLSSTCPHCQKANDFFNDLEKQYPWVVVHRYVINQNKSAMHYFYQQLQTEHKREVSFAVPAIYFCNAHWTGFGSAKNSGAIFLKQLMYCREKIQKEGTLSQATMRVLQQEGEASQLLSTLDVIPSKSSFIPLVAWMDSFSVLSLFCLSAWVCFLFLLPIHSNARRMGGFIFTLSLGLMHYLQQAHAEFYASILSGVMKYVFIWGVLLLAVSVRNGFKSKKMTIALGSIALCCLYYYQQTGVIHLSSVLEPWMAEQIYLAPFHSACVLIYQLCYVLPLFMLMGALEFLSRYQWMQQRTLQSVLLARMFLFYTGALLIIYPAGIASFAFFGLIALLSGLSYWLLVRKEKVEIR